MLSELVSFEYMQRSVSEPVTLGSFCSQWRQTGTAVVLLKQREGESCPVFSLLSIFCPVVTRSAINVYT